MSNKSPPHRNPELWVRGRDIGANQVGYHLTNTLRLHLGCGNHLLGRILFVICKNDPKTTPLGQVMTRVKPCTFFFP